MAEAIVARLPGERAGDAVLATDGAPFIGDVAALEDGLAHGGVVFHPGRIGGAWPKVRR